MSDPCYLFNARSFIGIKEVPGIKSAPFIQRLWDKVPWLWNMHKDDSTLAWCGAFVAHCLRLCGITPPKEWYRAKSYMEFGYKLSRPIVGAIAVIKNARGYHVGFVVGQTFTGNILILGGNQNDMVKVSAFKPDVIVAYRWVPAVTLPIWKPLPILSAELSGSEA